jgi:hypothetical protein
MTFNPFKFLGYLLIAISATMGFGVICILLFGIWGLIPGVIFGLLAGYYCALLYCGEVS